MPEGPRSLPPLLPEPQFVRRRTGGFRLREGLPIVLAPESEADDFASACWLRDSVRSARGIHLPIETHARCADLGPRIELRREADEGEAYRLTVDPGRVEVVASGRAGLRYALDTLAQLVSRRGELPACRIDDAPAFRWRGLLLDVSRGQVPKPQTLKRLVDLCAQLRFNVLTLYVEHTFRFRRHPEIGRGADPLDAETLRELDAYAAARHVELLPCLQSLGHMEKLLRIPRYRALAESDAAWSLAPTEAATYELLRDLYEEFLPNFRSDRFLANCDEAYDLGRGRSAARAAEVGVAGVFAEHVHRVRELARSLGKRTMIWADFLHAHPEAMAELARDVVLLDWGYEADHPYERVERLAEHGFEVWVCPGTSSWNALFPRQEAALTNIERWAATGTRIGAAGLLLTDWGDFGHPNLQGCAWLAYAFAAQHAWSGRCEPRRFERAFSHKLFSDPSGRAAALFRALGRRQDAGFAIPNTSPLQLLFFDDLDEAYFLRGARRGSLRRTARALERIGAGAGLAAAEALAAEPEVAAEVRFAAAAHRFAVRKALAGLEVLAWRERPERLDARGRTRLARELRQLAHEQRALAREHRRLWLRRSRPAGYTINRLRFRRSLRSLEAAARALERNRPPPPPGEHAGFALATVLQRLRASLAGAGGRSGRRD